MFYILAEILVPLESQTVLLGQKAHFFCQIQGRYQNLRLRIDGSLTSLNFKGDGLIITTENDTSVDTSIMNNISISITATKQRNNTKLECYDDTLGRESASNATLIIQGRSAILLIIWIAISCATGGPAEPEVKYEVLQDEKEILFSWPHPFTWKDYPITGYQIVCRDTVSGKIIHDITKTDTESVNRPVINETVDFPACYTLQCNVTASNALDNSQAIISLSLCKYFPNSFIR